jgi:ribosomal protein S6E (S10)
MNEYEINCVVKDNNGIITQLGFKNQGIHSAFIISRLILSERFGFYVNKNGNRVKVGVKGSIKDNEFLISNDEIVDIDDLNFLPTCNN